MAEKQILGEATAGVRIWCPGRPRTKGSLIPLHKRLSPGRCSVSLTESGEYSVPWKKTMIAAIREACVCRRWPGPVWVHTWFAFERLTKAELAEPGVGWELSWPTREKGEYAHGDIDKLERNVLDALTQSGLILDDALVVGTTSMKKFAGELGPGVHITVRPALT